MTAVSLSTEKFNIDDYAGMEPVQMMYAIRKQLEYKMPPIGTTVHTASFGGYKWIRQTWRCDVVGCWFVCTPRVDDKRSLEELIAYHRGTGDEYRCPTPPRRESLPSGLAEIEKLWREIDDVVDAIKSGEPLRGMNGAGLAGYVKGLAFSVVMKDKDLWPDIKAVSQQAGRRWKMRNGALPFEPTPTRFENDFSSLGQQGGWKKDPNAAQPVSAPPKKTAPKKVNLPADTVNAIKSAHGSGMFTAEELAPAYGITVAQVKQVLG